MDRLSSLPDELIGHILSFLPTKNFVQTSILAKQWRFLWTRFSVLGFTVDDDSKAFKHFHNNTIDQEFNSWINSTIFARNVQNVVIRLNYQITLPRCLFTSTTLVELCIIDTGVICMEGTVYSFPALKKLQLVNVGYDSETSLAHLISGCPMLEELIIDRMMLNYSDLSSVSNSIMGQKKIREMLSDKPALRYLRIRACEIPYIWSFNLHSLHSLIEADIDFSQGQFSSDLVRLFLPNLSNVKRLTLSSRRIETPDCWFFLEPFDFPNLTELNLRADWCFIPILLTHAKNLRALTLHSTVDPNTQCWEEWLTFCTPGQVYTSACLINHLETINLFDFEWSTNQEFEMAKYMLQSSKFLKTMELIYTAPRYEESDWKDKVEEALDRLALFEMGSLTCSIRLNCLARI